ncbi:inverse autotransporter beta domain-containing protein [Yersinia frederiksenii]|uniref:inverse autotransporter beta domain-containing protein n=1 Tax=Yersinia frederiksenii TaxID=29484 RepID=UPI001E29380A|nr:inverse autotransporter beta domain-containing protein [Yersinia frederiksenii]
MLRSAASNELNSSAQQWLSQFGTTRVQLNINDNFHLDGSAADILIPLYDNEKSILFTQLGARNKDSRNTVNMGAGVRTLQGSWMYGANTFFDNDPTGKNRRVGVGAEAWTDYLKLSANNYFGITDWHQSRDFTDYNERPANGYDLRAEAYLPSYPQLGVKVMYEKYRGDEVALFGKDNRQKNPHVMTVGMNYTPIPLVTIGAEHRAGKGGQNDSNINFQLNYRLGESWQSHIDPSSVAANRTLAGSRYDLVERNNNIVLDYQKQNLVRLSLPENLVGDPLSLHTITAQVTATHGLKDIDWQSAELIAAGGVLKQISKDGLEITLPAYQVNRASGNSYILKAIAYDNLGNSSSQASTLITVNAPTINNANSTLVADPVNIEANGSDTSLVTLTLRDNNSIPVTGQNVTFDSPLGSLSTVTDGGNGVYTVTLTAGMISGITTVSASVNGTALGIVPVSITLNGSNGDLSTTHSTLVAAPVNIEANGSDTSLVTLTLRDNNNNPVTGQTVALATTLGTLGNVTEQTSGSYTATLTAGNVAGTANLTVNVGGSALGVAPATVILNGNSGDLSTTHSTLVAAPVNIEANGSDTSLVTLTLRDNNNNPVTGQTVALATTLGTLGNVTEQTSGSYTATLTAGNVVGTANISVSVGGNVLGVNAVSVALIPIPVDLTMSVDTDRKNIGDTIQLTVSAKLKNTSDPAPNTKITFVSTGVTNRQNTVVTNSGTLKIDGIDYNLYTGVTDSAGELVLSITDPNGIGVKTTLQAVAESNDRQQIGVIFNIITSPDTPQANMWGYMTETLIYSGVTFTRPYLAAERTGISVSSMNNESWAVFTQSQASALCSALPTRAQLVGLYNLYPNSTIQVLQGWPLNTVYRTSELSSPSNGHFYVYMNNGTVSYNPGVGDTNGYNVSCIQ